MILESVYNTPVTLGRINPTDMERTVSVGVRQCSFYVMLCLCYVAKFGYVRYIRQQFALSYK